MNLNSGETEPVAGESAEHPHDWRPGAVWFAIYAANWFAIDLVTYVNLDLLRDQQLLMIPAYVGVVAGPATLTAWCVLSEAPARLRWPLLISGAATMIISKAALLGWERFPSYSEEATLAGALIVSIQFALMGGILAVAHFVQQGAGAKESVTSPGSVDRWRFGVKDLLFWTLLVAIVATLGPWFYPPGKWDFSDMEMEAVIAVVVEVAICAAYATPYAWAALVGKSRGCGCALLVISVPMMLAAATVSFVFHFEAIVLYCSLLPLRAMVGQRLPPFEE